MSDLSGERITVAVPAGWEGRIAGRRPEATASMGEPAASAAADEPQTAVVQLASFPLPPGVGDFGGGAVQSMTSRDVFLVLFEYGDGAAGTALFAAQGVPRVRPNDASPDVLRFMIAGQSAIQRFFTVSGRAFCLYVVLGSHRRRIGLVGLVNDILASLRIEKA